MLALSCTRRASQECHVLSRRATTFGHALSTLHVPPFPTKNDDEHEKSHRIHSRTQPLSNQSLCNRSNAVIIREYHVTSSRGRSGPAIFLTLGAIAATAKAGQYAVQGYNEWKEASMAATAEEEQKKSEGNENNQNAEGDPASKTQDANSDSSASGSGSGDSSTSTKTDESAGGKRENIFASFFNLSVGSKYYEGGFDEVMTRKEAALILGVRESSAAKRIKEAHRKLLILNHPDTGGSTFLAGKINEAKELLLKGKKR